VTTLHLVRRAAPPDGVVAPGDEVLLDHDGAWVRDRARPVPVPAAEVLDLVFRHARVAVW
jgi:hypothetical protein